VSPDTLSPRWHPVTRIAFRFSVTYFTLYVLLTQMLGGLLVLQVPDLSVLMNGTVAWTGRHVFGVDAHPVLSGSGDKLFDWVLAFCLLTIAAVVTIAWSVLDRRRERYERLNRWFRVFLRFALGASMLQYGFAKAIPLQMPAPPLTRLLEPYGNFSPMGVLWYSVGASFPYERFVGCMELLGGALLFVPRTAMLGALVCLADTVEIFVLNMTYDVPVKLFSFHLILMSSFLVAPDVRRLVATAFASGARARWAAVVQAAIGLYLLAMGLYGANQSWTSFGGGAPTPPLFGIWVVDAMTIDGQARPPLVTDMDRWRRVVIQNARSISFWRMDDTAVTYASQTDMDKATITLSKASDKNWTAHLAFTRPAPDRIVFDGDLDGHALHMDTQRFDREKFLLVSRGFHWVQEFPFNR
jgi:hypothetical protein